MVTSVGTICANKENEENEEPAHLGTCQTRENSNGANTDKTKVMTSAGATLTKRNLQSSPTKEVTLLGERYSSR